MHRHGAPSEYTPKHLAERILKTRAALEGERKPVTVLFCDIVNSTALATTLGPESMYHLLDAFFELSLAEVHRYEGTVNQTIRGSTRSSEESSRTSSERSESRTSTTGPRTMVTPFSSRST
jgi:hypothetical protein